MRRMPPSAFVLPAVVLLSGCWGTSDYWNATREKEGFLGAVFDPPALAEQVAAENDETFAGPDRPLHVGLVWRNKTEQPVEFAWRAVFLAAKTPAHEGEWQTLKLAGGGASEYIDLAAPTPEFRAVRVQVKAAGAP